LFVRVILAIKNPSSWKTMTPFLNHRIRANLIIEKNCKICVEGRYKEMNNSCYEAGPKAAYFEG
jgi:hypothetical protein